MQRRVFLKSGALALVTIGLSPRFLRRAALLAETRAAQRGKTLICLFQRGAADALNVLRLQLERMTAGYIPSLREYNRVFGVTRDRVERAPRDVLILHPGPMNRGVEIDSDVADGPHSVILDQVTNGVAVRMAVLYLLAGGRPELAEAGKRGTS